MIIGYFIKKVGIVTEHFSKEVGSLITYVTLPAYLITSMNFPFSKEMLLSSKDIFLASMLIYLLNFIIAYAFVRLLKIPRNDAPVYEFSIVFGNVGFMGYPVIGLLYGSRGIFYTAIFNFTYNALVWTLGVYYYTRDRYRLTLKEFLLSIINPGIVSLILGFVLFLLSIPIPDSILRILSMVGSTTTPLILMYIGAILANVDIKELLDIKSLWLTFCRLIIAPALGYLMLKMLGYQGELLFILVILAAMPVGTFAAMLAEKYNHNYYLASKLVFTSSFFCIITLTFLLNFIK
jgi:hypothetical protein